MSSELETEVTESAVWAEYLRQVQLLCKDIALGGSYALLVLGVLFYHGLILKESFDEDFSDLPFYLCCLVPSLLLVIGGGIVVKSEIEANHTQPTPPQKNKSILALTDAKKSEGRILFEKTEKLLSDLVTELKKEPPDQERLCQLLNELSMIVFKHESQSAKYNSGLWYHTLFNDIQAEENQLLRAYLAKQPQFVHLTNRESTDEKTIFDQIYNGIESLQKKLTIKEQELDEIKAAITQILSLANSLYKLPPSTYLKYWQKQTCTELVELEQQLQKHRSQFIHTEAHQLVADWLQSWQDTNQIPHQHQ